MRAHVGMVTLIYFIVLRYRFALRGSLNERENTMGRYNPRTVLRQTSNALLQEFFESYGHVFDVAWEQIRETQIEGIFEAMRDLPEAKRRELEVVLQDVHRVASSDEGIRVLVRENQADGFVEKLEAFDSRYDKAVWTCLNYPDMWKDAVRFFVTDNLSKRYWVRRLGTGGLEVDTLNERLEELRASLSAFFIEQQGRGHHCLVEHLRRSDGVDYFFAYLSNYAGTYQSWDGQNQLTRRSERRTFEVVFAYDRVTGALDTYVQGGKAIREPVQEFFSNSILGTSLPEESPDGCVYDIEPLKFRDFQFPTDPDDGVMNVTIKSMQLEVKMHRGEVITVKSKNDTDSIHDLLENDLNQQEIPLSQLRVHRATVSLKLAGRGRTRTLTFDLTSNACNLKNKPEELRILGEKYLRLWGIATDKLTQNKVRHAG